MHALGCNAKCISYRGLWSNKSEKTLVWTVYSFQTNVPEVQLWSYCSPAQTPLMANYCWPKEVPLSLWVPQPSRLGLSPFVAYLLLLVFISSIPEWAVICSLNILQAFCPLSLCFCCSLCLLWSLRHLHMLTTFQWVHISVVSGGKGQALESHQPEVDSRLCHLLCAQVI